MLPALRALRAPVARSFVRALSTPAQSAPTGVLKRLLADSIKVPYMQACLMNPDYGYYAGKHGLEGNHVLGSRGDFITSPEISQVFGELLAIFFVMRWQSAGSPASVRLVEFGPGRGTLLGDMLRTFATFAPMIKCLHTIQLVEASPMLIVEQEQTLKAALEKVGKTLVPADTPVDKLGKDEIRVEWFPSYHAVPVEPTAWTIAVAHEFFDALPIHIFEKRTEGWREVMVDVDTGSNGSVSVLKASDLGKEPEKKLRYVLSPGETPWTKLLAVQSGRFDTVQPGQRVEVSPLSWVAARRMGELVSGYDAQKVSGDGKPLPLSREENERRSAPSAGGCGLIIDYGGAQFFSNSFRAFRSHKLIDPLELPGESDLTANVDFNYLNTAINSTDARAYGLLSQGDFLRSMGMSVRVEKLTKENPERAAAIAAAAARLVDSTGMGTQYKFMAVSAPPAQRAGTDSTEEIYPFL
ncbi:hypothetical protein MCUN1_000858 [Malassezia cuniculi]|uniref:Protein arginine methyltransferase NDUFAF7 n=1 Tax=Malassezia cuniculi TaxID=948313 RepID=A0AAF0EPN9_9BASI|nr:hypothetical protein MCUN1_000858 [Malassezia cuniculi]